MLAVEGCVATAAVVMEGGVKGRGACTIIEEGGFFAGSLPARLSRAFSLAACGTEDAGVPAKGEALRRRVALPPHAVRLPI